MKKTKPNIDAVNLKYASRASAEEKFSWLQSALEFAQVKKRIKKR